MPLIDAGQEILDFDDARGFLARDAATGREVTVEVDQYVFDYYREGDPPPDPAGFRAFMLETAGRLYDAAPADRIVIDAQVMDLPA